jgi:fluoride exporter
VSFLYIFIGAGIGGVGRYLLGTTVQRLVRDWPFPIGTFVVNMVGCFLIGFMAHLAEEKGLLKDDLKLFVFVGLLGGFTTFSSFGHETVLLIRSGHYLYAACNAVFQVVLGLFFVWLGYLVVRAIY